MKFLFFIILFFIINLLLLINSSIIKISDGINDEIFEFSTPAFDLGNLDLPITSNGFVFGKGCGAINQITNEQINKSMITTNNKKLIFFVGYDSSDTGCFPLEHIFQCQERDWCLGILHEANEHIPSGFDMWSVFDKHRPRSSYQRPLVQATSKDFQTVKKYIQNSIINNHTCSITLTNDPNKWGEMFTGVAYLVFFRVLGPIWSIGCLIFICKVLWTQHKTMNSEEVTMTRTKKTYNKKCTDNMFSKLNLKRICLLFHAITHMFRIVLFVDPFLSQQIYPYAVAGFIATFSQVFEISTNLLLSFVIRELTQATNSINVLKEIRRQYTIIAFFIIFEIILAGLIGEKISFPVNIYFLGFYVMGFFHLVLGFWYLRQGYLFIKKCQRLNNVRLERVILTQISIFNSIGIIFIGVFTVFFGIVEITGRLWGYFSTLIIAVSLFQITSFSEILLFGGIAIDFRKILDGFYQTRKVLFRENLTRL